MRDIRTLCIRMIVVCLLLFVMDRIAGKVYMVLYKSMSGAGETAKLYYAMENADEDILILGSSRASHHYNPQIIKEYYPTKSVYNLGRDGSGFLFNSCQIVSIILRDTTKQHLFVVDMLVDDLGKSYYKNIQCLSNWYNASIDVRRSIDSFDEDIKYLYYSNLYKYSGQLLPLLKNAIPEQDTCWGYLPIDPEMNNIPAFKCKNVSDVDTCVYDVACKRMVDVINLVKRYDSKIIFVVSPYLTEVNDSLYFSLLEMKRICCENGVSFEDYSNDSSFINHPEYFKDISHLNRLGADKFTDTVMRIFN